MYLYVRVDGMGHLPAADIDTERGAAEEGLAGVAEAVLPIKLTCSKLTRMKLTCIQGWRASRKPSCTIHPSH